MMAASILKSNGIENFMNVAGGWGSIKKHRCQRKFRWGNDLKEIDN